MELGLNDILIVLFTAIISNTREDGCIYDWYYNFCEYIPL